MCLLIVGSLFFMNRFHKHIKRTIVTSFLREVYLKPIFACIFALLTSFVDRFIILPFLDFAPSGRTG